MADIERQSDRQTSPLAVVKSIFEDFNLLGVSDDVCLRVLDIVYKYTGEILGEAKALANYSGRSNITESDIKLAIDSKSETLILTPLHREQLLEYAEKVNSQPLPSVKLSEGLKLAPEKYTLTAPNFTVNTASSSIDSTFTQPITGPMASRITLPGTPSGVTVFRVASAAPGQLPSLVPAGESDVTADSGVAPSGLHVIAPVAAPASLIRVQSGNLQGSIVPLTRPSISGIGQGTKPLY